MKNNFGGIRKAFELKGAKPPAVRKGQMFLIIGVFVLLALVLLKAETSQPAKNAFYAGLDWKESFENIEGEYRKAADISLAQGGTAQSMETNMNNFSNFSLDSFNQRGYYLGIAYSFVFANSTNITAVFGNFYGDAKNVSLNLSTGASAFFPSIANRQSNSSVFPIEGAFSVNASFYLNGSAKSFSYSADSNITAAIYVLARLQQAGSFAEDSSIFNKTLG